MFHAISFISDHPKPCCTKVTDKSLLKRNVFPAVTVTTDIVRPQDIGVRPSAVTLDVCCVYLHWRVERSKQLLIVVVYLWSCIYQIYVIICIFAHRLQKFSNAISKRPDVLRCFSHMHLNRRTDKRESKSMNVYDIVEVISNIRAVVNKWKVFIELLHYEKEILTFSIWDSCVHIVQLAWHPNAMWQQQSNFLKCITSVR